MKRILGVLLPFALFFHALILPVEAAKPEISAISAILIDAQSGRVLYEKNAHERRPIASITKLMTALVAVESTPDLSELVTVEREWTLAEGSSMYLKAGEQLTLETLLYGLMLSSGNDAALAVAGYCAGDVETFVDWMNQRAAELGMENTHFANPNGLNDPDHYSTSTDMALLARVCMEQEAIAQIVGTKSITIGTRTFTNHNKLLWRYEGCIGMKTGYTQLAGRTLVSCAQRDGQRLIAVTLHDPDDWADHTALFDYGFETYPQFVMCQAGQEFGRIPVLGSLVRFVPITIADEMAYPLSLQENVHTEVSLPEQVEAPVREGEIAGSISFYLEDELVGESYLLYGASVESNLVVRNGLLRSILDFWSRDSRPASALFQLLLPEEGSAVFAAISGGIAYGRTPTKNTLGGRSLFPQDG